MEQQLDEVWRVGGGKCNEPEEGMVGACSKTRLSVKGDRVANCRSELTSLSAHLPHYARLPYIFLTRLPAVSAAARISTSSPSPSASPPRSPLVIPNTRKALPALPRMGRSRILAWRTQLIR